MMNNEQASSHSFGRRQFLTLIGGAMVVVSCAKKPAKKPSSRGPTQTTSSVATTPASDVAFDVRGDGPAIMFPSYARSGDDPTTDAYIAGLVDGYRIITFDGATVFLSNSANCTPEIVCRSVLAVADAAGVEQFAWWGYSYTATLGLQLAVRTERLSGLVCGGWTPLDGPYDAMLKEVRRDGLESMTTWYGALQDFDDRAAQSQITCPRMCYVGSKDYTARDGAVDTSLSGRMMKRREELESLGWDVQVLDGLDHQGALQPNVGVPLLRSWFDKNLTS